MFPDGTYGFDTATNDYLLRTNDSLGEYVTNQAKQYAISPQEITFDVGTHLSRISVLEPLQ